MKKPIIIASAAVFALLVGAGGTFGYLHFMSHAGAPKPAVPAPPKPLFFTNVTSITVSLPPDQGAPPTSFVQVGVQFSSYDQTAITSYTQLEPIIKADIISLMMTQTSAGLSKPETRAGLIKSCLDISNNVLASNANFKTHPAFSAAYITNLVVQE